MGGGEEEICLERQKNEEIYGQISNMLLILCYTVQLSYQNFVPSLIILSQVIPEKSLTENLHVHYIGMRDGKKMKKKAK